MLSDWKYADQPVIPPDLGNVITESNKALFNTLCAKLFDHGLNITQIQNIKGLIHTMLATFLMYLEQFKDDCSTIYNNDSPNIVLQLFTEKINGIFSFTECVEFGREIRADFISNNKLLISDPNAVELAVAMGELQEQLLSVRGENSEMKRDLNILKGGIEESNKKLSTMNDLLLQISSSATRSSSSELLFEQQQPQSKNVKRSRIEDEDSVEDVMGNQTSTIGGGIRLGVSRNQTSVSKETMEPGIVYEFGVGQNKCLGEVVLKELLEIALDKKMTFQPAMPGKATIQNFKCYTIKKGQTTPTLAKGDESRVREALTELYSKIDENCKATLHEVAPSAASGLYDAWHDKRVLITLSIQSKVVESLTEREIAIALKLDQPCPDRVKNNKTTTIMTRFETVKKEEKKYTEKLQAEKMKAYRLQSFSSEPSSSSALPMHDEKEDEDDVGPNISDLRVVT
jgi:hypothetical protein